MATHYIIMVDGKAMDIRGTSELAVRQGKVRKGNAPESRVEIWYGEAEVTYPHGLASQTITVGAADILATVVGG